MLHLNLHHMTWCQKKHFKQKHTIVSTESVNSKSMSLKPDLSYTFSICFCYLLICGHQLTKAGEITREKEEWTQIESNHVTDYYWYIFYQTWLKATFVFKSIDRMICACFSCYSILAGYSNCIHRRPVRYTSAGCTWHTNTQSQLFRVGWVF